MAAVACATHHPNVDVDTASAPADNNAPTDVVVQGGFDVRPTNVECLARQRPDPTSPAAFERVFPNTELMLPTMIAQDPVFTTRWFATQRGYINGGNGQIVVFDADTVGPPHVAATIGPLALVTDGEGGLLGMAFDPSFATNGRVFVSYVGADADGKARSIIASLTSTDGGWTFGAPTEVLSFEQTDSPSHKAGGIAFGKDGYLYASFGDGYYPADAAAHGQDTTTMFSKIIRIDVNQMPYGIPSDNPFANGPGEPAVYARGFRNPFRFSFDRATGQLWVGDVGEDRREEIDVVTAGGNYGWPCKEGTLTYLTGDPARCPDATGILDPVFEIPHNAASHSITGGVVYRGSLVPSLSGAYLYADFITQELFALDTSKIQTQILNPSGPTANWVHFAEDNDGEIYSVGLMQGAIYKMVPSPGASLSSFPEKLSETGCVLPGDAKQPAPGMVAYDVSSPLWSDGAEKSRWFAVPEGTQITLKEDGDFDLPIGSVAMKTFFLGGKRVETRLLMRHDDGAWGGYSFEWNDAQTDATLLAAGKTKTVGAQTWVYPSRTDCTRCHTDAAGGTLGLELGQLNHDLFYPTTGRVANQVSTLALVGMFDSPLPAKVPAFPSPTGMAPVAERASSYLHANCSSCHRPEGGGRGPMDLRFATPFAWCNVPAETGNLGNPNALLMVPGHPENSLISSRAHDTSFYRMPPLGTSVDDTAGLTAVDDWIRSLTACP